MHNNYEDHSFEYTELIQLIVYFVLLYICLSIIIFAVCGKFDSIITKHTGWLFSEGIQHTNILFKIS